MNSLRVRMLTVAAVALAAFCASAIPAAAQARFKGSFTLPNEVRWQGNAFKAGDYTFKMDSIATPHRITLDGPDGGALVQALVGNTVEVGTQSEMIIEHRGGQSYVRELYLAQLGLRLRYAVPKAPKEVELAQGPVTTETILIAMK